MQFLADIMRKMSQDGCITISDLYELSEKEVIKKIKECENHNISYCFNEWQNGNNIKTSTEIIDNKYCVNVKSKKRYINPLVKTNNGIFRISDISDKAKKNIEKCLRYTFDRYLYMDFNFNDKVLTKEL